MALWPNGKASLSGGEDCGFESHRRRIIAKFLDFFFSVGRTSTKWEGV